MIFLGIWFDLILILLFIIAVIIGFKKGLFSVVKRFRLIFATFFAWQLRLTGFVQWIVGKLFRIDKDVFYEKVNTEFGDKLRENIHNATLSNEQKYDETFGKLGGLLSGAEEYFMQRITEGADNLVTDITNYVAGALYELIYGAIGFALLFVFFFIVFTILYHVVDKILDIGVLGLVNHGLGGLLGALTGFIWAWLLAIIFVKIFPLILSTDAQTIASSPIGLVRWFIEGFFLSGVFGVKI